MTYVICSLLSMVFAGTVIWRYKDTIKGWLAKATGK